MIYAANLISSTILIYDSRIVMATILAWTQLYSCNTQSESIFQIGLVFVLPAFSIDIRTHELMIKLKICHGGNHLATAKQSSHSTYVKGLIKLLALEHLKLFSAFVWYRPKRSGVKPWLNCMLKCSGSIQCIVYLSLATQHLVHVCFSVVPNRDSNFFSIGMVNCTLISCRCQTKRQR